MNRKVIITCALTGAGDTVGKSEHVPVTPQQIAESGIEAARAGAAIVHVHVRDPRTGDGTREVALYREVVERLRDSGVDMVINTTAGMGGDLYLDPDDPSGFAEGTDLVNGIERLAHVSRAAARHLHAGLRQPELRRGQPGLRQHPGHAARGRQTDPGAGRAARAGDLRHRSPVVRQQAGRRGPDRRPADVPAVHGHPVRRAARARACWRPWPRRSRRGWCGPRSRSGACRCRGWRSRCCSAGTCGSAWRTTSTSAAANKVTNAQLVANAATIVTAMGAEVATPDEAREILALRPRT